MACSCHFKELRQQIQLFQNVPKTTEQVGGDRSKAHCHPTGWWMDVGLGIREMRFQILALPLKEFCEPLFPHQNIKVIPQCPSRIAAKIE